MSEFAKNFLFLNVHNSSSTVMVILGGIWLMLLTAGLWSVSSQNHGFTWKLLWSVALIVLPWVGMFLYSFRCVVASDFAFLKPLGFSAGKHDRFKAAAKKTR